MNIIGLKCSSYFLIADSVVFTPILMFGASKIGIDDDNFSIFESWELLCPVVPITTGLFNSTHSVTTSIVAAASEKSITTSKEDLTYLMNLLLLPRVLFRICVNITACKCLHGLY